MKRIIIWGLAILITLGAAVYQKVTGPTYPKKIRTIIVGTEYKYKLIRTHGGETDATVEIPIFKNTDSVILSYRKYPILKSEKWNNVPFTADSKNEQMTAKLPHQPPAGKYAYYISAYTKSGVVEIQKEKPVVIRFKGDVPGFILIPHIFFIFFGMLFANAAALFAFWKIPAYKLYTKITFFLLLLGGMILGPIVQKYAFGDYWTGVPFGWDLTDNKMLIGFIAWIIAYIGNIKIERRYLVIIAALITLIIFSIPHSMFGSELNRETGTITQGFIQFFGIK